MSLGGTDMVSKNNHQVYQQKLAERKQRWGIRKLSVGVASVLLGTTFMLYSNHAVLADTVPTNTHTTPTGQTAQADSNVADHQGSEGTAADQEKKVATTAPAASTTADQEKKVATTAEEKDKDKQTNASETPQNPTNVDKKDTEVTPTNDATPTTENTTNVGKKDTEVTSTNDAKPATQKTTAKSKVRVRAARLRPVMKVRSEEHTSELQSRFDLVCRLLLEKKNSEPTHETVRLHDNNDHSSIKDTAV